MALKEIWEDKIDGESDVLAEDINDIAHAVIDMEENGAGATFIPSVSDDGVLSWTNNKGLENPPPVRIKPQKNVDYFTEEDRQEIVNDVLASLPVAEEVSV